MNWLANEAAEEDPSPENGDHPLKSRDPPHLNQTNSSTCPELLRVSTPTAGRLLEPYRLWARGPTTGEREKRSKMKMDNNQHLAGAYVYNAEGKAFKRGGAVYLFIYLSMNLGGSGGKYIMRRSPNVGQTRHRPAGGTSTISQLALHTYSFEHK